MAIKGSSNYAGLIGWSVGLYEWLDSPDSKVNRYWRVIENGSAASKWPWQGRGIAGLWGNNAGPRGALHEGAADPFGGRLDQKFAPWFRNMDDDMLQPARAALVRYLGGGKGANMEKLRIQYVTVYRRRWQAADRISEGGRGRPTGPVVAQTHSPSTPAQVRRARRALYHWYMTRATDPSQLPFVYGTINRPIEPRHYYLKALQAFPLGEMQARALEESFAFALREGASNKVLQQLRKVQGPDNLSGKARKGQARAEVSASQLRNYAPHNAALASATADVTLQTLFRDPQGRFVNGTWQVAIREANELVAIRFQEAVAGQMEAQGHRPTTEALVRATMDRRNRYPRDRG